MKKIINILIATAAIFTTNHCAAQIPTAYNITMSPVVQASTITPFKATAINSDISSYIIETIPQASQGVLSISVNGITVPVSEGMMLTPDLTGNILFAPDSTFSGNVVFTYSAVDENSQVSNVATYTIPVIGKQENVLPIRLVSFSGNAENKKVQLLWQTIQENNSSYFELQKSTDGNNFETFATTTAKGNGATLNNYQQTDDLFFYNLKIVYYRIKMVDINGNFTYSPVVMIKTAATEKNNIKAWPLPFTSNLNVAYSSEVNETVKITLSSINGAAVLTTSSTVTKGNNTINLYQAQSITTGTYLLTISSSTHTQTLKVIKQ